MEQTILQSDTIMPDTKQAENIIEINHLVKTFGDVKAVNDISFKVKRGELFAFLGLNGAGKSTTINIMCGQLAKDSGKVTIDGYDLDKSVDGIKSKLGVVFQNSLLDKVLSVYDNLCIRAALYGIHGRKNIDARLDELDKMLDLKELYKRAYGNLSGGQRRRVDIARALIHKPEILILDEPTTGLDPLTRKTVWTVLNKLRVEQGITIFLTTHYLEEATDADYLIILDAGTIVAQGTPLELKNSLTGDYITFYDIDTAELEKIGLKYELVRDGARVEVKNTAAATELIKSHPQLFRDFEVTKGKLDDVFLAATGKKLTGETI